MLLVLYRPFTYCGNKFLLHKIRHYPTTYENTTLIRDYNIIPDKNNFFDYFTEIFHLKSLLAEPKGGLKGRRGGALPPLPPLSFHPLFFEISCFLQSLWQTMLFEVELIINNASLIYVYPNTIETCLTPNYLLFGRQLV